MRSLLARRVPALVFARRRPRARSTFRRSRVSTTPPEATPADVDAVIRRSDPHHRDEVARAVERAERARDRWTPETTGFLDPGAMASVEEAVRAVCGDEVVVRAWGGFSSAERRRATMTRAESVDDEAMETTVRALRVEGNFMFDAATHRDFLGAILGTGIAREKIGDVLIRGERGADVMTTPEMCEFLTTALTSVRTVKVTASEVDVSELRVPTPKVEEINTSEASTRLDALGSAGFRVSRSKFASHVASGDVKVNWREVTKGRHDLSVGDVISCRGKGRVEVQDIRPARKEGRFAVRLLRFV